MIGNSATQGAAPASPAIQDDLSSSSNTMVSMLQSPKPRQSARPSNMSSVRNSQFQDNDDEQKCCAPCIGFLWDEETRIPVLIFGALMTFMLPMGWLGISNLLRKEWCGGWNTTDNIHGFTFGCIVALPILNISFSGWRLAKTRKSCIVAPFITIMLAILAFTMTAMIHVKNILPEIEGRTNLDRILSSIIDPIEQQGGSVPEKLKNQITLRSSSDGKHRTYRVTINAGADGAKPEWEGTWHYCPTCRKGRDHYSLNGGLAAVGKLNKNGFVNNDWERNGGKHCGNGCGSCCEGFDHHCPWLGACIHVNNRFYFMGFLFSTAALCGWLMIVSVYHMISTVSEVNKKLEAYGRRPRKCTNLLQEEYVLCGHGCWIDFYIIPFAGVACLATFLFGIHVAHGWFNQK